MADTLQHDIVLMDLQPPTPSGVGATHEIVAAGRHVQVLVVTRFEAPRDRRF